MISNSKVPGTNKLAKTGLVRGVRSRARPQEKPQEYSRYFEDFSEDESRERTRGRDRSWQVYLCQVPKIFCIVLAVAWIGVSTAVAQTDATSAAQPEPRPDPQNQTQSEPQPETQTNTQSEVQPEAQPEQQPEAQADQSADQQQDYTETIKQAVYEADLGNWQEARALFKKAHILQPNARTFRGMGMVAFNMRNYVQAIRDLRAALEDERRKLTQSQRDHVGELLHRAYQFVGRFRLQLEPARAVVQVDGKPLVYESDGTVLMNLGEHSLRVTAPGHGEWIERVKVEGGEERVLKLMLKPESAKAQGRSEPSTKSELEPIDAEPGGRLWTWVALGGAVAFGAAGITFGLIGDSKYDELKDECSELGCLRDRVDTSPVETSHTLANVFYGVSGACFVTAVALFFIEADDEDRPQQNRVGLSVGPGTVRFEGRL